MKKVAGRPKAKLPRELTTPIRWDGPRPPVGLLGEVTADMKARYDRLLKEAIDRVIAAQDERLRILANHMGIDTRFPLWQVNLCTALASQLYKGFTVEMEKPRRRPQKWDIQRYLELAVDVEKVKRDHVSQGRPRPTDADAVKYLVGRSKRTGRGRYLKETPKTLQNRLVEARDPKAHEAGRLLMHRPDDPDLEEAIFTQFIRAFGDPGN
jgi:hypothetical protein